MAKRIWLTLDDELYDLIMRFSILSGVSCSSFVASLLKGNEQHMREMIETLEKVQKGTTSALEGIDKLVEVALEKRSDVDDFVKKMSKEKSIRIHRRTKKVKKVSEIDEEEI